MKKIILSMLSLLVAVGSAEAKNWKVGPSSVTGMDFASINAAMESSDVLKGDTLYLDQYYIDSEEQTVNKQVVIIGTGYDTSLTDEQVVATLTNSLHLKANSVKVKSVKLTRAEFYNQECMLERCYISDYIHTNSTTAGMNYVYSCYVNGYISGYSSDKPSKMDIQNSVVYMTYDKANIFYLTSSVIRFNTIIDTYSWRACCISDVINTEISNNIILKTYSGYYDYALGGGVVDSGSGNSIEHNILSHTSNLYYFPTNKIGFGGSSSELFMQTGNYSDYYKLAESSAALGYATDGGEVGCHGGMFGCPAGGRPQYIPYFSKVTVGSVSNEGKLPVSVTIKIQDK